MPNVTTRWFTPEEADGCVLQDGEGIRSHMTLMDGLPPALTEAAARGARDAALQTTGDSAAGARDAAYQAMVDHIGSAYQGADANFVPFGEKQAVFAASLAAAEATRQRIADAGRPDGEAEHRKMVEHLNSAWRGAA